MIDKILIFSGTTEGRILTEKLSRLPVQLLVSVATEYGRECAGEYENTKILTGRMDADSIRALLLERKINLVIDATHPFARAVTENIRSACEQTDTRYIRCLREKNAAVEESGNLIVTESVAQAAEYLKGTQGNIFIATGSKELRLYTSIPEYKERCYARVLSTQKAVEDSVALGFEGAHLIAMQGPFSRELNCAMLRQTKAVYFVTKESGKSGGFDEKMKAARDAEAVLVVIARPEEEGMSLEDVEKYVKAMIQKDQACG